MPPTSTDQVLPRLQRQLAERAAVSPPAFFEERIIRRVRQGTEGRPSKPSWRGQLLGVLAVVAIAVAAGAVLIYLRGFGLTRVTPIYSATPTATSRVESMPRYTGTTAPIYDVSGIGPATTRPFDTSGKWTLNWSYDCANGGSPQSFKLVVWDQDARAVDPDNPPVSQAGPSGSGTQTFNTSSVYYFAITTACSWHVTVRYVPHPPIP